MNRSLTARQFRIMMLVVVVLTIVNVVTENFWLLIAVGALAGAAVYQRAKTVERKKRELDG